MSTVSIIKTMILDLYRYVGIPVLAFGSLGNMLNIVIFTRPQLVKNPCSTYFFWSSVAGCGVLFCGLFSRILSDGFGLDPSSYNLAFCRCRYFMLHSTMVLPSWFTILAGVDRYCVSSRNAHRRQLSNLRCSRLLVGFTTVLVFALYSHVFGLFVIEQLKNGQSCYAQAGGYRIFYDFFYFATFSFTPPIVMSIVGLATLHNVRQTHARIGTTEVNNQTSGQLKKRDRQLVKMLLVQVVVTVSLTSPLAVQKLYSTFTQNLVKDSYSVAVESLVTHVVRVLAFTNSAASFYM